MILVLDTNTVSELLRNSPRYVAKWADVPESAKIYITPITVFEILMKGRYQAVLVASNKTELMTAYARLQSDEAKLNRMAILSIDDAVADIFESLLANKKIKKIGRADLLIACIALAHQATLVTRNTKDFAGIPNLRLENWAE